MIKEKLCPECKKPVEGRTDKIFCSMYCKSAFHYKKNLNKESLFNSIDIALRKNRRILKNYNKSGKSTVRKEILIAEGFNTKYFTHYWKAKNGNVYLFCYEYGFYETIENGKPKYVLVTWQDYMK